MRGLACTAAGAWALLRAAVVGALGLALVELLAQKVTEVGLQKQEEQARACTNTDECQEKQAEGAMLHSRPAGISCRLHATE
jgi:hypothetical protein